MNTGPVVTRYARALLRLVTENGCGNAVYSQSEAMLCGEVPAALEKDIESLLTLLLRNGRETMLKDILRSFTKMYRETHNIKKVFLKTAVPSPSLEEKLSALLKERTGCEVEMHSALDSSIIGGFVFEVDDLMLDASVSTQIENLRKEFVENIR